MSVASCPLTAFWEESGFVFSSPAHLVDVDSSMFFLRFSVPSEGWTNPILLFWMGSSSLQCLGSTLLDSFWCANLFLFMGYPKLREKFAFAELPEVPVSLFLQPIKELSCLSQLVPSANLLSMHSIPWFLSQEIKQGLSQHKALGDATSHQLPVGCFYYSRLHTYKRVKNRKNHLRMWTEKADVEK